MGVRVRVRLGTPKCLPKLLSNFRKGPGPFSSHCAGFLDGYSTSRVLPPDSPALQGLVPRASRWKNITLHSPAQHSAACPRVLGTISQVPSLRANSGQRSEGRDSRTDTTEQPKAINANQGGVICLLDKFGLGSYQATPQNSPNRVLALLHDDPLVYLCRDSVQSHCQVPCQPSGSG